MVSAIILAAGKGTRLKGTVPKQYLPLSGRPVLRHTLEAFSACERVDDILLVVPEADFDFVRRRVISLQECQKPVKLIAGGSERRDSVYHGLQAIEGKTGIVVIHDGVRPFIRPEQISACIAGAIEHGACMIAMPAFDTLKRVDPAGFVKETVKRDFIWLAQTPQAFQHQIIKEAHDRSREKGASVTDDAWLVEQSGKQVKILKGSPWNIKITTKEDLALAEAILASGLWVLD
jgi:2-C-methyl-D-erythritol 4-phosphate cytidylyltransferase